MLSLVFTEINLHNNFLGDINNPKSVVQNYNYYDEKGQYMSIHMAFEFLGFEEYAVAPEMYILACITQSKNPKLKH